MRPGVRTGRGGCWARVAGGVWSDELNSCVNVIVYNNNADNLNLNLSFFKFHLEGHAANMTSCIYTRGGKVHVKVTINNA